MTVATITRTPDAITTLALAVGTLGVAGGT